MPFFNHFLREKGVSNELRSLLYHIARSIKYINFSLRAGNTGRLASSNASGEEQMALDVLSDKIITEELEKSELASVIASEEQDAPQKFTSPRGQFGVTFDPLDGSSLINANLSIGSIFGIWDTGDFVGTTGRKSLLASCFGVYGPRVTFTIAIKGKGVHEFELNDVGEFVLTRENIQIKSETKYFAPGNLRATTSNEKYLQVVQDWIAEKKTLRYSGGMVPDLNHILCKEEGIFCYPADDKHENGKLRLLFECAPFSFLFEEAGGAGLDQEGNPVLDMEITDVHQRIPIFVGSRNEVAKTVAALN